MHQLNVKSTFPNGPLEEEEVYVKKPPRFEVKDEEIMMWILRKELYGLNQTPREWNKRIDIFLAKLGFNKCTSEQGVCVKGFSEQGKVVLCLYVYDLLVISSNQAWKMSLKCKT